MESPLLAGRSLETCRLRLNIANSFPALQSLPHFARGLLQFHRAAQTLSHPPKKASPNLHLLAPKASTVPPSSMMGFSSTRCNTLYRVKPNFQGNHCEGLLGPHFENENK
ncbi:hypothetical protein TNCV_631171 [Trichonephila clavipes]|nr:hypothetical protein TNCV_631171 [Trichonephila clavipes]